MLDSIIKSLIVSALATGSVLLVAAQPVPLAQEKLVGLLNQELSGESAKRNLEYISRLHRMRASDDYNRAISFISGKLADYNLESIELIKIPVDGKLMYGTQKSRPAWNAKFAELWELEEKNGHWIKSNKIADWESIPLVLAQDSKSAEVTAELVDIGAGTSEADYKNRQVQGKLVLTSSQPEAVTNLAIKKYGAVGIISYAQNQVTAWWKENENLIRWGHLHAGDENAFAFMVSLKQARSLQEQLEKGDHPKFYARVVAETKPGNFEILTAVIKGTDPALSNQEILYTCHLDHPRPGANDNASGCVAILEVARTLKKLIDGGRMERPKRTIRFLWSPEIEGTTALLSYKPEFASRTAINIHMDMVGGGPETKAIFHVSRGPQSIPSFINDVGESFGEFLNDASSAYASGKPVPYPIVSAEGGKEDLHAELGTFDMGSDFQVFTEGSYKIPSIYLHDWPDRYIHTNFDVPANIDPTKLKRSAFIGAGAGYYLGNFGANELPALVNLMKRRMLARANEMLINCNELSTEEQENTRYYFWQNETNAFTAIKAFATIPPEMENDYKKYIAALQQAIGQGKPIVNKEAGNGLIYARNKELKGGMVSFSYDYFFDHYGTTRPQPAMYSYTGNRGDGTKYTYETLNFVDGKNTVADICNKLSAEFGPIPMNYVTEYLEALASINVIKRIK